MYNAAVMCIIQSHEKLVGEFSHEKVRYHLAIKPNSEALQRLPN